MESPCVRDRPCKLDRAGVVCGKTKQPTLTKHGGDLTARFSGSRSPRFIDPSIADEDGCRVRTPGFSSGTVAAQRLANRRLREGQARRLVPNHPLSQHT